MLQFRSEVRIIRTSYHTFGCAFDLVKLPKTLLSPNFAAGFGTLNRALGSNNTLVFFPNLTISNICATYHLGDSRFASWYAKLDCVIQYKLAQYDITAYHARIDAIASTNNLVWRSLTSLACN
ncbi:hypothetical protein FOVSG1_007902 [Fusarium oxysporum f. sp. vasinfectum]